MLKYLIFILCFTPYINTLILLNLIKQLKIIVSYNNYQYLNIKNIII